MALTHVCIFEEGTGYRRITIEEACKKYPYGISAGSGIFVCELCGQNVLLTSPGRNSRHFRHDPASPNKECEERQSTFDPSYGRSIVSLNSHLMPLRIIVNETNFSFELGFFLPPEDQAYCDKIEIYDESQQAIAKYSFERIASNETTYLNVGGFPSQKYFLRYINATPELRKYWPDEISGVHREGAIFEADSGQLLQPGGKAYSGKWYYLLQFTSLRGFCFDIEVNQILVQSLEASSDLYLYQIRAKQFSKEASRFFIKYKIFLTEKSISYYPIWPTYIERSHCIYHFSNEVYMYISSNDGELQTYPSKAAIVSIQDGNLYRIRSWGNEQLVLYGRSGALGFSYLVKRSFDTTAELPAVMICDEDGNLLEGEIYTKLPKSKAVTISCSFDGKAMIKKGGKTKYVYQIRAGERVIIERISFGTEILIYQGNDRIRSFRFEQEKIDQDFILVDENLVQQLKKCGAPWVPITHSIGAIAEKLKEYPQTKKWLYKTIKKGKISRQALVLIKQVTRDKMWRFENNGQ